MYRIRKSVLSVVLVGLIFSGVMAESNMLFECNKEYRKDFEGVDEIITQFITIENNRVVFSTSNREYSYKRGDYKPTIKIEWFDNNGDFIKREVFLELNNLGFFNKLTLSKGKFALTGIDTTTNIPALITLNEDYSIQEVKYFPNWKNYKLTELKVESEQRYYLWENSEVKILEKENCWNYKNNNIENFAIGDNKVLILGNDSIGTLYSEDSVRVYAKRRFNISLLSKDGNILWNKKEDSNFSNSVINGCYAKGGNWLITGEENLKYHSKYVPASLLFIKKINSTGKILWNKNHKSEKYRSIGKSIEIINDTIISIIGVTSKKFSTKVGNHRYGLIINTDLNGKTIINREVDYKPKEINLLSGNRYSVFVDYKGVNYSNGESIRYCYSSIYNENIELIPIGETVITIDGREPLLRNFITQQIKNSNIEINLPQNSKNIKFSIYSLSGRVVRDVNLRAGSQIIPISDLSSGMYISRVLVNGKVDSMKFMVK